MTMEEKAPESEHEHTVNGVPSVVVQQAEAAAAAAQEDNDDGHWARTRMSMDSLNTSVYQDSINSETTIPPEEEHPAADQARQEHSEDELPDVPPPSYGEHYGEIVEEQQGLETKAYVVEDGRVDISIDQHTRQIANLLGPALRHQQEIAEEEEPPPPAYIPPSLGGSDGQPPPPPMNVVIHVVGSRGDVQPFIALGLVLKQTYGHRVRLATHLNFKDFVLEHGLEFFNIGGDPTKLMAFMVKNPGLMPGVDAMQSGDIGHRRDEVKEMLRGCWRSCYEAGDGTGPEASDASVHEWAANPTTLAEEELNRPFVADAIIANPPSFAHIHVAEKLGIPLHIMFTMPYSPTQAFPHPLANIKSSNADPNITNYLSYSLVEMLTWQGLGDVINSFRSGTLALDEISTWSHQVLSRLKIPHTYCWSPALIPKPSDWRRHINIAGFYFLDGASSYSPPAELQAFLDNGPAPVYIGFGSIVLDDPNAMTKLIFDAVRRSGQRALVSKGWGGVGADELDRPGEVFMLGNCPHDWLFQHVSCVVHHGGAGTTSAGIKAGRPTTIVPFFGDQPFWGSMVHRARAGPEPIPHKKLTAENLSNAIEYCLRPETQERAQELAGMLAAEQGTDRGAQLFHQFLGTDGLRCSLAPSRVAVWYHRKSKIGLSAVAACTLANAGLLDFKDLKLFRSNEYEVDTGPIGPISGGAGAIIGTVGAVMGGVMTLPLDRYKRAQDKKASKQRKASEAEAVTKAASNTDLTESPTTGLSPTVSHTDKSTPNASRSASTFNLEESLAKLGTRPALDKSESGGSRRKSSRSSKQSRPSLLDRKSSSTINIQEHLETARSTTKGVLKIIEAGLKSPMDFTDGVARGFHNAPKLYGDETVRPKTKVSGFSSGVRAATRDFGLGMYDGITGLVSHPVRAVQKDGPSGLVKGLTKGIGGLVFKPGAAAFSIPSNLMRGVYKELHNVMGSSVQTYIIAARTAQGYEDWNSSTPEERDDIIKRYLRLQREPVQGPGQQPHVMRQDTLFEQPETSMPGTFRDDIFELESSRTENASPPPSFAPQASASSSRSAPPQHMSGSSRGAYAESVASSSTSAPPYAESRRPASDNKESLHLQHPDDEEDEQLREAIRLSSQDTGRYRHDDDDADYKRALAASLAEPEDPELHRALAESRRAQGRDPLDRVTPSSSRTGLSSIGFMPPSRRAMQQREPPPAYDDSTAPQGLTPDGKTPTARSEEQIVMDYVKKQSMLEQQHRDAQRAAEGSSSSAAEDEELRKAIEASLQDESR